MVRWCTEVLSPTKNNQHTILSTVLGLMALFRDQIGLEGTMTGMLIQVNGIDHIHRAWRRTDQTVGKELVLSALIEKGSWAGLSQKLAGALPEMVRHL